MKLLILMLNAVVVLAVFTACSAPESQKGASGDSGGKHGDQGSGNIAGSSSGGTPAPSQSSNSQQISQGGGGPASSAAQPLSVSLINADGDKLNFDRVLTNANNNIHRMNQFKAMKACPLGWHLPTLRELVKVSQARGAKGIMEVSQVDPANIPKGYKEFKVRNPDGQIDRFYFSYEGYKRPSGELGENYYWSSSVSDESGNTYGFVLLNEMGALISDPRESETATAVHCELGQTVDNSPKVDGLVRKADGSIPDLDYYRAEKACPKGTHIPTIRELAKESQANGAKGILEVSQVNPKRIPEGYMRVSALNPDGQKDEFYFSHDGGKRVIGELGNFWVWSSSSLVDVADDLHSKVHYTSFGDGDIYTAYLGYDHVGVVARCFVNH